MREIFERFRVEEKFSIKADACLLKGDTLKIASKLPAGFAKLIINSPPYNIGKEYETQAELKQYLNRLTPVIEQLARILHSEGSICWQVGNCVENAEIFPLYIFFYPLFKKCGFKLRNRIVWYFDHGLHASKRFSGRYETML